MDVLLGDLYLTRTQTSPGLLVNVSGVLRGHIIAVFPYNIPALGRISMFIFTVLMKLRMDY